MLAAALHGPALACLGLIGALAAPLLVNSENASAWPVVLYIAVVASAAYALARLRGWLWLAIAAALGGGAWGLVFLFGIGVSGPDVFSAAMVHLVVQTVMASFVFAIEPHPASGDRDARPDLLATLLPAGFGSLGSSLPFVTAAIYAGVATLTPLALLCLAFLRLAHSAASLPFAAIAGALALLFVLGAGLLRSGAGDNSRLGLGALASAAIAAL